MLKATSKVRKAQRSNTHYISIPSTLTQDSTYPFKEGEEVEVQIVDAGGIRGAGLTVVSVGRVEKK